MVLPNFIGIGAQRAATTWTYSCLKEHPDVYTPAEKELHFFDEQFEKGISWYEEQFKTYSGQTAIGEITPNYLNVAESIPRMARTVPGARLFVILREPVDRALSAYKLFRERFGEKSFPEALNSSEYLRNLGLYARQLKRVFQYYDREQVKVFLYEDVQNDPADFLANLFRFLAIDDTFRPTSMTKIYNRILFPKAQKVIRKMGLGWSIKLVRTTPLGGWIKRRGVGANVKNETIDQTAHRELRSLFRDDVLRLQDLIDRDLSAWL